PPDVQVLNPCVPDSLARVLKRMLAKDPDDRFQTHKELMRALAAGDDLLGSDEAVETLAAAQEPPAASVKKPPASSAPAVRPTRERPPTRRDPSTTEERAPVRRKRARAKRKPPWFRLAAGGVAALALLVAGLAVTVSRKGPAPAEER